MSKSWIEKSMRLILIGCGLCGLAIYFYGFPVIGRQIIQKYPEFQHWFYPWLIFLWATGVPCFVFLTYAWKIIGTMQTGKVFIFENGRRFRLISRWISGDAIFLIAGNLVLLFCNMNHPGVCILSFGISLAGFAVAVVCQGLALLTDQAAELQEQSDFTI